jgi:hypothetical protein
MEDGRRLQAARESNLAPKTKASYTYNLKPFNVSVLPLESLPD